MKRVALGLSVASLMALAIFCTPAAIANQWNEKTIWTFSQPVEIPGMVLPAGTYVFKLADSTSNRDIVQIFNKDENHIYATILAIPDYRLQPTGHPVIEFEERPSKSPQAVLAWFYPGRNFGEEFVYPYDKAAEIARRTGHPVLFTRDVVSGNGIRSASVKAITPSGEEEDMDKAVTTHR